MCFFGVANSIVGAAIGAHAVSSASCFYPGKVPRDIPVSNTTHRPRESSKVCRCSCPNSAALEYQGWPKPQSINTIAQFSTNQVWRFQSDVDKPKVQGHSTLLAMPGVEKNIVGAYEL